MFAECLVRPPLADRGGTAAEAEESGPTHFKKEKE